MDIGVHLPHMGPYASGKALVRLGRVADDAGYHSVWFSDHLVIPVHFEPRYPYDPSGQFPVDHTFTWTEPFTTMSFVAGATERVKLGFSVLVVPYRHPVVLGAQTAALQFLSGGRMILGAGCGWMKEEFGIVGVPYDERGARTDECLEVVVTMCSKSPAEYHGRYYDLPPSGTMPLPDSPPPVWIGGHTGPALRRAARWQGWHAFQLGPDEVAAAAAQLPDGVTISVRTRLDPDDMPGTVRHLEALRKAGADHVTLDIWSDIDGTEDAMRRFAKDHLSALA